MQLAQPESVHQVEVRLGVNVCCVRCVVAVDRWFGFGVHNFNADEFDSLRPRYAGGRPPVFGLQQRARTKQIALGRPADHGLPFSTWSLIKLADYLVAERVVEDISHEGPRQIPREQPHPGRQWAPAATGKGAALGRR